MINSMATLNWLLITNALQRLLFIHWPKWITCSSNSLIWVWFAAWTIITLYDGNQITFQLMYWCLFIYSYNIQLSTYILSHMFVHQPTQKHRNETWTTGDLLITTILQQYSKYISCGPCALSIAWAFQWEIVINH